MTFEMLVIAIIAGLGTGALAGFVTKGGDYGVTGDIILGLGGSFVSGWLFRTFGIASGGGWFAMVTWAVAGAAILIFFHRIAQRFLWPVRP